MGTEQNRVLAAIGAVSAILAAGGSSVFASQVKAKKDNVASGYTRHTHVSLQAVETLNRVQKGSHHVSVIYPGQTAPVVSTRVQAMAPILRTVNRTAPAPHTYVVKAGDNLWSIAEAKHTTVANLVNDNQLTSSVIHVGQQLSLSNTTTKEVVDTPSVETDPLNVTSESTATAGNTQIGNDSQSMAASQADTSTSTLTGANAEANANTVSNGSDGAQSVSPANDSTVTSQTSQVAASGASATAVQSSQTATAQSAATAGQTSAVSSTANQTTEATSGAAVGTTFGATTEATSENSAQAVSQPASATTSAAVSAAPTPEQPNYDADQTVGTQVVQAAVNYESQQVPYVWGGTSTSGMDCSGLVQQAYAQAGVNLPHDTVAQEAYFTEQDVSAAQPGDVLFWGQAGSTYHNAIAVGNNQYIAAPKPGSDVQTYTMDGQTFMPSFSGHLRK